MVLFYLPHLIIMWLVCNIEAFSTFILKNFILSCFIIKYVPCNIIFFAATKQHTRILCPTDLRAARGTAHIRPVLFVIHVIGRPAKPKRQEQHVTLPPHHSGSTDIWSASAAAVSVQSFHSAGRILPSALRQCR